MIILSHKIQIKKPTFRQERYFRQACGTSRFAYNWGLSMWKKQYEAGQKPTARNEVTSEARSLSGRLLTPLNPLTSRRLLM
jgi:transposase